MVELLNTWPWGISLCNLHPSKKYTSRHWTCWTYMYGLHIYICSLHTTLLYHDSKSIYPLPWHDQLLAHDVESLTINLVIFHTIWWSIKLPLVRSCESHKHIGYCVSSWSKNVSLIFIILVNMLNLDIVFAQTSNFLTNAKKQPWWKYLIKFQELILGALSLPCLVALNFLSNLVFTLVNMYISQHITQVVSHSSTHQILKYVSRTNVHL